jgi:cytochrome P450
MPEQTISAFFTMDPLESRSVLRAAMKGGPTLIDEDSGAVIVLRHREVTALLTDQRLRGVGLTFFDFLGIRDGPLRDWYGSIMFTNEGAAHHRMRSLVGKAFSPRSVEALRPVAAAAVAARLAAIRKTREGDLIAALSGVPTQVMCTLLGVPDEDVATFNDWVGALSPVFVMMTPEQVTAATDAITKLLAYTNDLCARREKAPTDDLVSALIAAEHDGDRLTRDETARLVANLLVAGHDTTGSQMGCTLLNLLPRPDVLAQAHADPALASTIVMESIRLEPALPIIARTLTAPADIGGSERPEGSMIWLCSLTAGLDPDVWRDPLTFDPHRFAAPDAPRLLTFGAGTHACLGTWLARLTLEEAVRGVAEMAPSLAEPAAEIEWVQVLGANPVRLPVAVHPSCVI